MSKYLSKYRMEIIFSCLLLTACISYGAATLRRFSTSNEALTACKEWQVKINNSDIGCINRPWDGRVVVLELLPGEEKFRVKKSFPYGGIFDKRPSPPLNSVVQ